VFDVFKNAWKVKDLRSKLLYTLFMLMIIRLGVHVPVPGVDNIALKASLGDNMGMSMYSLIAGGGLGNMSIFSLGIGPYITSSIIMQLLTVALPKLEQLSKEGEEGRKKIQKYSRNLTIVLALIQASGTVYSLRSVFVSNNIWLFIVAVAAMVAGSTFIMWMGEQITAKGVGNGSSLIIFINIISNLPQAVSSLVLMATGAGIAGWIKIVLLLLVFLVIIVVVVLVQQGERRLPVQYSKKMVGRKMFGGQSTFIPIKVNTAGVISIIFAISLLQFPQTIGQFIPNKTTWFTSLIKYLQISHPVGAVLYIVLIVFFSFFYTSIVFNPVEVADNMKKNGGFIPGIRPGQPTANYISKVSGRITLAGAICYSFIAMVPVLFQWIFKINHVGFGGTTLMIVVGVCLETFKQIESQLLMRHYKGFLTSN
jgi:preprotein translocase subunit SecY